MKTLSILFSLFISLHHVSAQSGNFSATNTNRIDTDRYADFKGSPYLFKNWMSARIIGKDQTIYEDQMVNFNGYTKEFEVRGTTSFIRLDEEWYQSIEISKDHNPQNFNNSWPDKLLFFQGLHKRFGKRFVQSLFHGKSFWLLKDNYVNVSEQTVNNVGKAVEFKRFVLKKHYYVMRGEKLSMISLKKKDILKLLADKKEEVEKFVKEEKISWGNEAELVGLLRYYDDL